MLTLGHGPCFYTPQVDIITPGNGMQTLKLALSHVLNPLHVYCRLRDAGVATPSAKAFCNLYERWLYKNLRR